MKRLYLVFHLTDKVVNIFILFLFNIKNLVEDNLISVKPPILSVCCLFNETEVETVLSELSESHDRLTF